MTDLQSLLWRRAPYPPPLRGASLQETSATGRSQSSLSLARRCLITKDYFPGIAALQSHLAMHPQDEEADVMLGLLLMESQQKSAFEGWMASSSTPPASRVRYAEYWSAVGQWFLLDGDATKAASAFLEAVEIDPTSLEDYQRLARCLPRSELSSAAGFHASLQTTTEGWYRIRAGLEMVMIGYQTGMNLDMISDQLLTVGRPVESLMMQYAFAKELSDRRDIRRRIAEAQRQDVTGSYSRYVARLGVSQKQMPLPSPVVTMTERLPNRSGRSGEAPNDTKPPANIYEVAEIVFDDIAKAVGLDFTYRNAETIQLQQMLLHEGLGGGAAWIDYDLDGSPDLYLGQGGLDPSSQRLGPADAIYRNQSARFVPVTNACRMRNRFFTTGVGRGDLNQDGFPDLCVHSLGPNRWYVNQGDGTFEALDIPELEETSFSTSVAVADISGDGLPDVVELNYVETEGIYDRSAAAGASPVEFGLAENRWFECVGDGRFVLHRLQPEDGDPRSSLGLVVGDFCPAPGNEVFVANDGLPNRFWSRWPDASLGDSAAINGLALDASGKATAAMGIAVSDFDDNGRADFHVTNFWDQPSSLYLQIADSIFQDRSAAYGLDSPTLIPLGFGTQTIDMADAGSELLVVLNGHINNYESLGYAFRMRPQCFVRKDIRFALASFDADDEFWNQPSLGRVLAKADFDGDGDVDLVATHLDRPTALLRNRSEPAESCWRIRPVGRSSERSGVGCVVSCYAKTISGTRLLERAWATAGDGYLCSNEPVITIAVPATPVNKEMEIRWPSGQIDRFAPSPRKSEWLCVEGERPFLID